MNKFSIIEKYRWGIEQLKKRDIATFVSLICGFLLSSLDDAFADFSEQEEQLTELFRYQNRPQASWINPRKFSACLS